MSSTCNSATIDFIVKQDDPEMEVVEDYIRQNLEEIGITVNTLFLNDTEYTDAELNGKYNVLFTRSWGAPYDPHSYMSSWAVPSHVEYSAIGGIQAPLTRDLLLGKIEKVQTELDEAEIATQWREILEDVHKQAIFMPLWGTRIPYVLNRRLTGFTPAEQAYSIPVNNIQVLSGSPNVTVAPGVGSLFKSVGPINPHQYSPNALWAQDWIYEGLVSYGQDGMIEPALAETWSTESTEEGQRVTFQLRQGVQFHDGTPWNCDAAKLNFDHVLSETVKQRHQWFGAGKHLKSWTCIGDFTFVLETSSPFYPLIQELTYIRPLRFASPSAFAQGSASDPDQHNSCQTGNFGSKWDFLEQDVTCLGLTAPIGTGPFKYVSREEAEDGSDASVVFARHDNYWGQNAGIETLTAVRYATTEDVEEALMSGELDMALGIGPLKAKQVQDIKFSHSDMFDVRHSDVIQHALLVFNTDKEPTNDPEVRRAIIHAIDKSAFLQEEFAGLEQPVTQMLPLTAPYCDVDLNPKWGYDIEKAKLLSCPPDESLGGGAIAGIVAGSVIVIGLVFLVIRMIRAERAGKPLFTPTVAKNQGIVA
jgi:ABC-type transport system substrate-binding protein